jgi:ABC-type transport system substrate-binding protein
LARKLLLTVALLAVGGVLVVPGAGARTGGTLVYDNQGDFRFMDPQLSYYSFDWTVLQATCLKLLNWPDVNGPKAAQLQPEAATGYPKVSNGGRTYDFTVDVPWTKFYPGNQPVTAQSFKNAFDRIMDPKLQSPASQFTDDVQRVAVRGKHLVVTLKQAAPDFLARIGMEFFCAVPNGLPRDPGGVEEPPMAGPYYIADWTKGRSLTVKRNPNYRGKRPHNLNEIDFVIGNSPDATQLRIDRGQADLGNVPPASYASIGAKYGVNKGRFFVQPALQTWFLGMNHDRPLFGGGGPHGNTSLTRAINYAVDRHALIVQAGAFFGRRTDQILPPLMPGYREANLYPTVKQPNVALAKKLAAGHTDSGSATLVTFAEAYGPLWAQVIAFNLKQLGLDVKIQTLPQAVQLGKIQTRGEDFDLAINGWGADYADPYDFLNVILDGTKLQAANNANVSYFDDPLYNRKMAQAASLTGAARYAAYGKLDLEIMKTAAPIAPMTNANRRYFVSSRLGCFTYQPVLAAPNLAALCLK